MGLDGCARGTNQAARDPSTCSRCDVSRAQSCGASADRDEPPARLVTAVPQTFASTARDGQRDPRPGRAGPRPHYSAQADGEWRAHDDGVDSGGSQLLPDLPPGGGSGATVSGRSTTTRSKWLARAWTMSWIRPERSREKTISCSNIPELRERVVVLRPCRL